MLVRLLLFLLISTRLLQGAAINVSLLATAGNGTSVSPWTGWDTAVVLVNYQEYSFPGGVYACANCPNFLKLGIALVGEAGTILRHTGSGNGFRFDNPSSWTDPGPRIENIRFEGNPATTTILFWRGVRNGILRNVEISGWTGGTRGFVSEACVTNTAYDLRVYATSQWAITLASRATNAADGTTTWTFINPVIEHGANGVLIDWGSLNNTFIGGTAESNTGKGALIHGARNVFISTDFEANGGTDIELAHEQNVLLNVASGNDLKLTNGGSNRILGGEYRNISIGNVHNTMLTGVRWGTLSDAEAPQKSTVKFGNYANGQSQDVGITEPSMVQIDYSTVINSNCINSLNFFFTAYGPFTLANPTNGRNGIRVTWRIQNFYGGPVALSFGSKFRVKSGDSFPILSPVLQEFTYIGAIYNSQRDTWDIQ